MLEKLSWKFYLNAFLAFLSVRSTVPRDTQSFNCKFLIVSISCRKRKSLYYFTFAHQPSALSLLSVKYLSSIINTDSIQTMKYLYFCIRIT